MKTAIILAAGSGERLKPLTHFIPKALAVVKGTCLIESHLLQLKASGYQRVIINHAYLGGQIKRKLGTGQRFDLEIIYAAEPPGALESCGGIVNALRYFDDEEFIVINADIMTDYDFKAISIDSAYEAILILVRQKEHGKTGDFSITNDHDLNNEKIHIFSGIAYYRRDFFSSLPYGRYSIVPIWREKTTQKRLGACLYEGYWQEIGTMENFLKANEDK